MFETSCEALAKANDWSLAELVQKAWASKPKAVTVSINGADGSIHQFSVLPHQTVAHLKMRTAQLSGADPLTQGLYLNSDCGEPLQDSKSVDDILSKDQEQQNLDLTLVIDSRMPTLMIGAVFVQGGTQGLASYHFVSADEAYISYTAAPAAWKMDDGSSPPECKPFTNTTFDKVSRTFTGHIVWEPVRFSCYKWEYTMVFDEAYQSIVGGACNTFDHPGSAVPDTVHRFNKHLYYTRLNTVPAAAAPPAPTDAHNLEGITADESGVVTRIHLFDKGLEGKHSPGRHQWCYKLLCVYFLGPIPGTLSQLQSLRTLSLRGNELSGAVNMFGTSPVMSLVYVATKFSSFFSFAQARLSRRALGSCNP